MRGKLAVKMGDRETVSSDELVIVEFDGLVEGLGRGARGGKRQPFLQRFGEYLLSGGC
jgi:hypothetical protein